VNERDGHIEGDAAAVVLFYQSRGWSELSAERRLMLAVLVDALNQAYGLGYNTMTAVISAPRARRTAQAAREARQWLMDGESTQLFSAPIICETLGIDFGALRQTLLKAEAGWRESAAGGAERTAVGGINLHGFRNTMPAFHSGKVTQRRSGAHRRRADRKPSRGDFFLSERPEIVAATSCRIVIPDVSASREIIDAMGPAMVPEVTKMAELS